MKFSSKKIVVLCLILVLSFSLSLMAQDLPREETLVVVGAMWSPPSTWNTLIPSPDSGTGGLVYETMFSYDPINYEYRPWLAESGEWVSENQYLLKLRKGIKWTDGEELNADDVVFTYEIAKNNSIYYSPIWDWLDSVEAEDNYTVRFSFSQARYEEWDSELYQRYIIPEHIWSEIPETKLITRSNKNPVGTGPYKYYRAEQDRMIWERNDNWWGNAVFGNPKPKYIVDLVNKSNNIVMGMLMKGELDLSNNFTAGIQKIKDQFGLKTWYEKEPYMISWDTTNLYMNTNRKPMDDRKFRRAVAYLINVQKIVDRAYGGLVEAAPDTGLFGAWAKYHDQEVVEEYGYDYNLTKAKALLDNAGYIDLDGDGWRDLPNGDPLNLELIVPSGWTDWMAAVKSIAADAEVVGLNIVPSFPDYGLYDHKKNHKDFDMLVCNFEAPISSSPFTYWDGIANDNIKGESITTGNWGAYDNPELFNLIDDFNMTKDEVLKQEIAAKIQQIILIDMPSVTLWHNGLWSQATESYWTNWPDTENPYGIASTWVGTYQLGMIDTLIGLEKVK